MLRRATRLLKADVEYPQIPLEPREDNKNEVAIVACGDFVGPQERFQKVAGVVRVLRGYTGSKKEAPSRQKIYDYTEALLIEFDSQKVSYNDILDVWHECDNPWESHSKQYQSALYWRSLKQQDEALHYMQFLQAKNPTKTLHTVVERAFRFYKAKQNCRQIPLTPKWEGNDIAIVACGNFLIPKDRYQGTEGVKRVLVGYTNGVKEAPKDYKPYDHTEAVLIEYNPEEISYRGILDIWHEVDDPFTEGTRQYRSAIFWKSLSQQDTALSYIHEIQVVNPSQTLHTEIERARKFYEVEIYDNESNGRMSRISMTSSTSSSR